MELPYLAWQEHAEADVVVVGAGIAGLSFALRLPESMRVIVVTKGPLGESNTRYAQGGIAAAIGPDDTADLHLDDTIAAGAGLTDEDAARAMSERGASAVRWLLKQGTRFDLNGHILSLGQEAAHSRRRILHAGGDATGAEIERALVAQIHARPHATVLEHTIAVDIAKSDSGDAAGVVVARDSGTRTLLAAPIVALANGGAGQLWAVTSNPDGATADGIGMAFRAGLELADLEFAQFHPTVFNAPDTAPFLISEAVRGEGAWLVNGRGERFMTDIDERAELAPRNVVAGEIHRQLSDQANGGVYLTLRHLDASFIEERFPTIGRTLARSGYNLSTDLLPVAPAMHYFMGGVVASINGRTSMPGVLAIGEVSCTGVHGANRLASNSLLEGLVFGINAADQLTGDGLPGRDDAMPGNSTGNAAHLAGIAATRERLQAIMSRDVGVMRDAGGLHRAISELSGMAIPDPMTVEEIELRNMLLAGRLIAEAALAREESRGGHIRADYPGTNPALDGMHQIVVPGDVGAHRWFGKLPLEARR